MAAWSFFTLLPLYSCLVAATWPALACHCCHCSWLTLSHCCSCLLAHPLPPSPGCPLSPPVIAAWPLTFAATPLPSPLLPAGLPSLAPCCHCCLAYPLYCHHVVCHWCRSCVVHPCTATTVRPAQLQPLGLHLLATAATAFGSPISPLLPPSSLSSPATAWLPTLTPCCRCLAHSLSPPLTSSSPSYLAIVVMLLGLPFLAYCCHHLAHRLPGITAIWPTHFCHHSTSPLAPMRPKHATRASTHDNDPCNDGSTDVPQVRHTVHASVMQTDAIGGPLAKADALTCSNID
jgi:hypothetical protein